MELLRYLNSPEYQQAQEEQWARVRGSYEVRRCLGVHCARQAWVAGGSAHGQQLVRCAWPKARARKQVHVRAVGNRTAR